MYTIRKVFKLEGAHILSRSFSKVCQRIHGHSYRVEIFISTEELNADGMVVDFKLMKNNIGYMIDCWDHRCLVSSDSYKGIELLGTFHDSFVVVPFNPTAENMCKDIYDRVKECVPNGFTLKVRIHETDTGYAEYYE